MKYIIIVDNNQSCGNVLKALLQYEMTEEMRQKYMIATWCANYCEGIEQMGKNLCKAIQKIYENNEIHFLIDLLLTENEERQVDRISDQLTNNCDNPLVASGIMISNMILKAFKEGSITISFMSKWLNLRNEVLINEYNGIRENPLWKNRNVRSFINPINEEGCIINRTLPMPQNGAKTLVDVAVNIAFDF